jgi:hypothetical protein
LSRRLHGWGLLETPAVPLRPTLATGAPTTTPVSASRRPRTQAADTFLFLAAAAAAATAAACLLFLAP